MGSNMVRADFWQQTDLPPGSNNFRMVYANAAGRISWRSNMHGLEYGSCRFLQRTDSPPGSNMLRLAYADSGSACKLAGVQISLLPTLANQILARTFFRSVVHLFACSAVEKFCRASSAGGRRHMQERWRIKFSLERFSDPSCFCVRAQPLESSLGRVPQAADGTCVKIS